MRITTPAANVMDDGKTKETKMKKMKEMKKKKKKKKSSRIGVDPDRRAH